jgi:hypothetical protein
VLQCSKDRAGVIPGAARKWRLPLLKSPKRRSQIIRRGDEIEKKKKKKLSACRGEGSVAGLQLRVRFVPAALLSMLRTALALQCVSKARDWIGHVDR